MQVLYIWIRFTVIITVYNQPTDTTIYKAITNYVVLPQSAMKITQSYSMSLTKLGLHCHKQKSFSVLTIYRILHLSYGISKLP